MSVVEGTSLNNDEWIKNLPSHILGAQKCITAAFHDARKHSTQQQVYNAVERKFCYGVTKKSSKNRL